MASKVVLENADFFKYFARIFLLLYNPHLMQMVATWARTAS